MNKDIGFSYLDTDGKWYTCRLTWERFNNLMVILTDLWERETERRNTYE